MKINQYHGKLNRTARNSDIKYIVCHYVGNGTSAAGSAKNNCIYFSNGVRNASAHYFIDDGGIWEYADPKAYATWHCGDGHGAYGITNQNSIGIEVCIDGDRPYTEKEIGYLSELVQSLMKKFSIPASRVVRHYDASRKQCPYYYAKRPDEWEKLRRRITGIDSAVKKGPATYTNKDSKITVANANWPSSLKQGQAFNLKGTISDINKIKRVVIGISDSKGIKWLQKMPIELKPTNTFDIAKQADTGIKFGKMPKGSYRYRAWIVDKNGATLVINKPFTVS